MRLSELYNMSKGRFKSIQQKNKTACSTDASFTPDNDLVELVWENGQIMMQGQSSSKARTFDFPSHTIKSRDRDLRSDTGSKIGSMGTTDSTLNDFTLSVPSGEMGTSQDDEMLPWLNYHIDDSLHHDYCSEFLAGSSGITENELSNSHNKFPTVEKRSSFNQTRKFSLINGSALQQGSVVKVSDGEVSKYKAFPPYKSRILNPILTDTRDLNGIEPSCSPYSNKKMQKQDPVLPNPCSTFINFSHFSRPVAMAKGNIQNISALSGPSIPSLEGIRRNDKGILASIGHQHATSKLADKPRPNEKSDAEGHVDPSKNVKSRTVEPAVASSSVCSVTNVGRNSNSPPTPDLKRKFQDTEDSDHPSDDVEEESIDGEKAAPVRVGSGSKRSRAAEVHNLSERRRRDRINEKMRALQELIPNCIKVDKASMLDEAIEYLKTLQLQVQIMSMGTGMYMPQMMLPAGIQHMHASHMPHFSPMNVGPGMGFGMGVVDPHSDSPGYSVMPMHHTPGPHFRGQPFSGQSNLHGGAGSNLFGLSSRLSMAMQHSSVTPPSAEPDMAIRMSTSGSGGLVLNPNSVMAPCSKEPSQNPNVQVTQNANASILTDQMSSQNQGKTADFKRGAHISGV